MGTMLIEAGMPSGGCPEQLNITQPQVVAAVHSAYIAAGADIIETNTFGANRIKLAEYGLAAAAVEINRAAVAHARAAITGNQLIAGSVGPTGKLLQPLGELSFAKAYDCFLEQIRALDDAGVDMIIIETMIDLQEARAALIAAKSATVKPVICQMSFDSGGRTMSGTDAGTAALVLDKLGADIIGVNCSTGPEEMLAIIEAIDAHTDKPISAIPNAGMPTSINGVTVFPMQPAEFAEHCIRLIEAGASYVGGCCGTTPEHIAALRTAINRLLPTRKKARMARAEFKDESDFGFEFGFEMGLPDVPNLHDITAQSFLLSAATTTNISQPARPLRLAGRSRLLELDDSSAPHVIGERINPTNRKLLAEELRQGVLSTVLRDALDQQRCGATILDINVGISGIDQAAMMETIVLRLSSLVDCPLCMDTTNPEVLEAGLRSFPGRALINSVSLESKRLNVFLELAKKYGAAVMVLPVTDEGIPTSAGERLTVAKQIITAGLKHGLQPDDFIIDPLVLSLGADEQAAAVTLATVRLYRAELGMPVAMGLSNVSFGLPARPQFNASFLLAATGAGVTAPILNPLEEHMRAALPIARLINGIEGSSIEYIKSRSNSQISNFKFQISNLGLLQQLAEAVYSGDKEQSAALAVQCLTDYSFVEIASRGIASGMVRSGNEYIAGALYLPQVLLAAEAAQAAFNVLNARGSKQKPIATVAIGTVSGDIHDLGKNIVVALLKNSGFDVIDLGKNVSREDFLAAFLGAKPDIIGFSSLMTTTMHEIAPTIALLREHGCTAKFICGGAVITAEYARECGADGYASDAVQAVELCKRLLQV